jgi:amidohydrolase
LKNDMTSPVDYLRRWHAELTDVRRDLHAHPELGFEEHRTARIVCERLTAYGIEHHAGVGRTGVVAVIPGRADNGRSVGLRADMDALPMQEENDFAHKSRYDGRMHGCGHDGHTTMLLAAARYLHETRAFDGTVHLIFQPGEEGYAGARAMIEDGLFDRFPCDQVFALHNWPALPPGRIGVTPGPAMAAADRIEITIDGRGGHGAHPHIAVDPVLVAGHIITAAQSIVSRNVSPLDTAVVSLCAMQAGNPGAMSVIPAHAKLVGTVRTFRTATQDLIEQRLNELVSSIAAAFGARATLNYERVYPPTVNHDAQAELAARAAEDLVGRENVVRNLPPSMGAEDFSFMLEKRPGAFARLGQGGVEGGCFLHNSKYDFNDAVIPLGALQEATS